MLASGLPACRAWRAEATVCLHLPTCAAVLQVGPRDTLIGLAVRYHVSVSADVAPPCWQLPG